MKIVLRVMAIVLAMGAISQTIYSYAQVSEEVSEEISEEAEQKAILNLITLRQKAESRETSFHSDSEFNQKFIHHTLRYIQAIGAAEDFEKVLNGPDFKVLGETKDPGI